MDLGPPRFTLRYSSEASDWYKSQVLGIALEQRDGLRYGYRFWSDRASGLLLRAQTLTEKGEVIEQIAFTQLSIGKVRPSQVKTSHANTRGWRVENASASSNESSGWKDGWLPGGFKLVSTSTRVLGRTPNAVDTREVIRLVFFYCFGGNPGFS